MTTEATQNPQGPQPTVMDIAEIYRILGRLEAEQTQAKEHLIRIEQRFDRQDERNEQRFRDVNRRIDRLWYTIVGIGAALAIGYVLDKVIGGG